MTIMNGDSCYNIILKINQDSRLRQMDFQNDFVLYLQIEDTVIPSKLIDFVSLICPILFTIYIF